MIYVRLQSFRCICKSWIVRFRRIADRQIGPLPYSSWERWTLRRLLALLKKHALWGSIYRDLTPNRNCYRLSNGESKRYLEESRRAFLYAISIEKFCRPNVWTQCNIMLPKKFSVYIIGRTCSTYFKALRCRISTISSRIAARKISSLLVQNTGTN